jgi:hypothetical protein
MSTIFASLLVAAQPAIGAVIDFQNLDAGPYGSTLVIGDVTFQSPVELYVGTYFNRPYVNRALCSLSPDFISCESDLTISFASAVSQFDITVDGANTTAATISAIATLADDSIQTVVFDGFEPLKSKTLFFSAAKPIRSVRFTTRDPQGFSFDDLHLGAGAVPEPNTWAFAIVGIALIGGRLRRSRALPAAI